MKLLLTVGTLLVIEISDIVTYIALTMGLIQFTLRYKSTNISIIFNVNVIA